MNEDFFSMADKMKNECLLKTEALFVANRQIWFDDFSEHFNALCGEIRKLQEESRLSPISYMEYTMLYTNFVNRWYTSEIIVYGDEYCLDEGQRIVGEYDIAFLFVYFGEMWDKLIAARKKYAGRVTAQDVNAYMLGIIPEFYSYFTTIVRFAVADLVNKEPFTGIVKGDVFMLNVGEYMAKTEPVFTQNKNKDAKELTDWFFEELDEAYMCGDYSGLDFSGKAFPYNNYCYANFRNSSLSNVSFEGAMLIGTDFRSANMEGCRMDKACINEADFTGARLKNACFANALGRAGLSDENEWRHAGFLPVSFRNADLTRADFRGADLTGADFRGADTTGADFTDAILNNASFND